MEPIEKKANNLFYVFTEFLCDSDLQEFINDDCSLTEKGKLLLKLIKKKLKEGE